MLCQKIFSGKRIPTLSFCLYTLSIYVHDQIIWDSVIYGLIFLCFSFILYLIIVMKVIGECYKGELSKRRQIMRQSTLLSKFETRSS